MTDTFQAAGTVHAIHYLEHKWGAGGGRFTIVVSRCGFNLPERILNSRPRYGYSLLEPDCPACLVHLADRGAMAPFGTGGEKQSEPPKPDPKPRTVWERLLNG